MTAHDGRMARLAGAICPGPLAGGQLLVVSQLVEAAAPLTPRSTTKGGTMTTTATGAQMAAPGMGFDSAQADAANDAYGRAADRWGGLLLRMADDECRHGRLPGDRTDPCGCYPCEAPGEARTA